MKKTVISSVAALVAVAGIIYSTTRTKRGVRARKSAGKKARRITRKAKAATSASVTRAQDLLGKDTKSAGYKTAAKKD